MAKLAVHRPLYKCYPHHYLRTHPMRAYARQPNRFGERWLRDLQRIQLGTEVQKQLRIKPGTDLAAINKVDTFVVFEVADQQRPEADPPTLRIGKPATHEILRRF